MIKNVNSLQIKKLENHGEKKGNILSAQRKHIIPPANEILHNAATNEHSLTANSFDVLRSSILINYSLLNAFIMTLTLTQASELVQVVRTRRSLLLKL